MTIRAVVFSALICGSAVLCGCPEGYVAPGVRRTEDVVYARAWKRVLVFQQYLERPLLMDIVRPEPIPDEPLPAVVMVHGGSFTGGSKDDDDLVTLAARLARAGYVCFLIDYRLVPEPPPAPADLEIPESILALALPELQLTLLLAAAHAASVDTRAAIRHVRANAEEYGVNPDRIAVLGESAGAFAALAAGYAPPDDFAADEGFPVSEFNAPDTSAGVDSVISLWGNGDHVLDAINPGSPALLLVHGTEDEEPGTPFEGSERLRDAAEAQGVYAVFVPVPGADHGAWRFRIDGENLADKVIAFLDR